ncbi:MAG: putative nucleic acid-binding protein [Vicingaceae bacterium]|jgi:predicted nucleic acid-binding protein
MKHIFLGLLFISIISCNKEKKSPDYLLEQDKFVKVLTDFETAEAIVRLGYNRTKDSLIYNDSVYVAVFRKHEITKAIFDSNFTYYSNKPQEFEKIFEKVITNLSTMSAKIQEKKVEEPTNKK